MTTLDERHGRTRRTHARRGAAPGRRHTRFSRRPPERADSLIPLLSGSKAANLARATRAGLPVLPGFVIPHSPGDSDGSYERRG